MKPNHAIRHIQFILDNQKTVQTSKLKKLLDVVIPHNKMLEKDNRKLRGRVKRQRKELRRIKDETN